MANQVVLITFFVALLRLANINESTNRLGCVHFVSATVFNDAQEKVQTQNDRSVRRSLQRDGELEKLGVRGGLLRNVDLPNLHVRQNRTGEGEINERLSKIRDSMRHKARDAMEPLPQRKPITENCERDCDDTLVPLCGSDGVTYKNPCEFESALCSDQGLYLYRRSFCDPSDFNRVFGQQDRPPGYRRSQFSSTTGSIDTGTMTSYQLIAPSLKKKPTESPSTEPRLKCPDSCYETVYPVCGSDGRSYKNLCFLLKAACLVEGLVHASDGACQQSSSDVKRSESAQDVSESDAEDDETENSRGPVDDCNFKCKVGGFPICGSDGQTYENLCKVKEASCKTDVRAERIGSCDEPHPVKPTRLTSRIKPGFQPVEDRKDLDSNPSPRPDKA
eukprot:Selendium_serpulae@DN5769_c1_g1_i1.p1